MANSQLTTILLLLAVGVIIYYISQPTETKENLENSILDEESNNVVEAEAEVNNDVELDELVDEAVNYVEDEAVDEVVDEVVNEVVNEESSEVSGMPMGSMGASLNTAFMGAIPPNTATDQVDFNRNNVTEFDSSQYLPKEVNDEWFDTDFTKAKYNLNDDKMINTNRYIIGVNTVGQTLKNPSYDIRGTIPNPKYTVSPWMNSTYEPDNNIKSLY